MPTTFPDYRMRCGWNALLPSRQAQPELQGVCTADVVIVGAGFTGLACARRWQQLSPDSRIALIDSSELGEGNPGRNSGFLLEIALADDADSSSTARMEECNRLTRQAMQSIVTDVKAYGADVDLQKAGTYRAAAGSAGLTSLRDYQAFLDAAGLPYRSLNRDQMERELGTRFYAAGLYSPDCYLAQPAAVIRAIAAQMPDTVTLYENTPALHINRHGATWQVRTPQGELHSPTLVLANNAHAKELGAPRSHLASVYTYAGLTPVLDDELLNSLGSNTNWGILPTHRLGSTLRRTADGRLLVRSLHHWEREGDPAQICRDLQDRLRRRFPQLDEPRFEQVWGGAVGFTYNAAPLWGQQGPNLFVSAGCNGGGTVKGTLLGRLLAELAHGEPVPDIDSLFGRASWMPPEPIRGLGFHIRAGLESWQGRQEL